jgi:hypothetical protein
MMSRRTGSIENPIARNQQIVGIKIPDKGGRIPAKCKEDNPIARNQQIAGIKMPGRESRIPAQCEKGCRCFKAESPCSTNSERPAAVRSAQSTSPASMPGEQKKMRI